MSRYPTEQTRIRFAKLPRVLKDAMFSEEIAEKIYEIGHNSGLNIEKIGFLAEEAGYVILGLTRPNEFIQILADRLEVSDDVVRDIAKKINHQIFYPLREALKSTHQIDVGMEETLPSQQQEKRIQPPTDSSRIDLRAQYRPRPPETTPKTPPINLKDQPPVPPPQKISREETSAPHRQFEKRPDTPIGASPFQISSAEEVEERMARQEPPKVPSPPPPPPPPPKPETPPTPQQTTPPSKEPPQNIPLKDETPTPKPEQAEQKPPPHTEDPYREPIE